MYIYATLFSVLSESIVRRLRISYMRSFLSRKIEQTEKQSSGAIADDLSAKADTVQLGISEKLGTLLQAVVEVISSFVVAFIQSWQLTLVLSTSIIVLFSTTALIQRFDTKLTSKIMEAASVGLGIVEEAYSSMPSIIAFEAQEKILRIFVSHLEVAKRYGLRRSPLIGLQYSTSYFVLLSAYALAYWYGCRLLLEGKISNGGEVVM